MPRGKLEIWNEAMSEHLGVASITSLTESSPAGEQCRLHYDSVVATLLEAHWWVWARARVTLTSITNDRPTEWSYKYYMPGEIAAIRWVNDPDTARGLLASHQSADAPRETSADYIYTDVASAVMEYTALITDAQVWPARFIDAVKATLAARSCLALTENGRLRQDTYRLAETYLERAIVHDEANATQYDWEPVPDWLRVRGIS